MLAEVAACRRPRGDRRRAACVKLFQRLRYIRNEKMLEDYSVEEGRSVEVPADPVQLTSRRLQWLMFWL